MKALYLIFALLFLPACDWFSKAPKNSGVSVYHDSDLSDLHKVHDIDVRGVGTLLVSQGDDVSLRIDADEKTLEHITTQIERHTLLIRVDNKGASSMAQPIVFHLILNDIEKIDAMGSIVIRSEHIRTKELELKLTGATRFDAVLDVEEFEIEASGSAKCNLSGHAEKQELLCSGAVHYNAGGLVCDECDINVSGSSRITVNVREQLSVKATGVAIVGYIGDPDVLLNTSGSPMVKKVG